MALSVAQTKLMVKNSNDDVEKLESEVPLPTSSSSADAPISVFRSARLNGSSLICRLEAHPDVRNIWELFMANFKGNEATCCVGSLLKKNNKFSWMTRQQIADLALRVGSALLTELPPLATTPQELGQSYIASDKPAKMVPKGRCCCPMTSVFENDKIIKEPNSASSDQYTYTSLRTWKVVGLFCNTSYRIQVLELMLGASAFGISVVLMDKTLSLDNIFSIIQETKMATIIGEAKHVKLLTDHLQFIRTTGTLKNIISFDNIPVAEKIKLANELQLQVFTWANLLDLSRSPTVTPTPPPADTVAIVSFSRSCEPNLGDSAKIIKDLACGVILTHRNYIASVSAMLTEVSEYQQKEPPFHKHGLSVVQTRAENRPQVEGTTTLGATFSRLITLSGEKKKTTVRDNPERSQLQVISGGRVGYSSIDGEHILTLYTHAQLTDVCWKDFLSEVQVCNPTFLCGYPRLALMLLREINLTSTFLRGGCCTTCFRKALKEREVILGNSKSLHKFGDSIKFKKFRNLFGTQLRNLFLSYGTSSTTLTAIQIATGFRITTFFGVAETCGVGFFNFTTPLVDSFTFNNFLCSLELDFPSTKNVTAPLRLRGPSVSPAQFVLERDTTGSITLPLIDLQGWLRLQQRRMIDTSAKNIQILETNDVPAQSPIVLECPLVSGLLDESPTQLTVVPSVLAQNILTQKQRKNKKLKNSPLEKIIKDEIYKETQLEYTISLQNPVDSLN